MPYYINSRLNTRLNEALGLINPSIPRKIVHFALVQILLFRRNRFEHIWIVYIEFKQKLSIFNSLLIRQLKKHIPKRSGKVFLKAALPYIQESSYPLFPSTLIKVVKWYRINGNLFVFHLYFLVCLQIYWIFSMHFLWFVVPLFCSTIYNILDYPSVIFCSYMYDTVCVVWVYDVIFRSDLSLFTFRLKIKTVMNYSVCYSVQCSKPT